MEPKNALLFINAETFLHAGAGRGLGSVDLPIQRERSTGYPIIQGSGVKGPLRATARNKLADKSRVLTIFGPETENAADYAGAISVSDARIILLPVRSLSGVFALTTSLHALARLYQAACRAGLSPDWDIPDDEPGEGEAWMNGNRLLGGDEPNPEQFVVLEEFSFTAAQGQKELVKKIGTWLANNALLDTPEYKYFKRTLPERLCILSENAFRDFCLTATEVQTHVHLDPDKKKVLKGQLWMAESLPADTLLYAPITLFPPRKPEAELATPDAISTELSGMLTEHPRITFGGDETTGQGLAAMRWLAAK